MLLWALVLICLPFILFKVYYSTQPRNRQLPPGPGRVPIIGSIPFVPRSFRIAGRGLHTPKLFYYLAQKYGAVCHIWLGPVPTILISDANILKEAFKHAHLTSRPIMKPFHEFRYGSPDGSQRGVILSTGAEWDEQRKFTIRHLRSLGFARSTMESAILHEVTALCDVLATDEAIDLCFKTNLSIVNALWMIIAGQRFDLDDQGLLHLVQSVERVMKSAQVASLLAILLPNLFKWTHPRFKRARDTFEECKTLMRTAIKGHMENRDHHATANDFIDIYLDEIERTDERHSSFHGEKGLRSLEVVLVDLFIGGSETTATSINWTILYLLHYPQVQQKIHAELDNVVGKSKDAPPTLSHKGQLHYVNAVIAESMRKSSVVPSGVPHYVEEDTWLCNYFFPKGTNVMANLTFIHYDPKSWSDPEEFKPERFLDQHGQFSLANKNWMPFSLGKRFCLGKDLAEQEFYLFLTGLLHRFTFESPVPKNQLPNIKFCQDDFNTGFVRYPPFYSVILRPRF